MERKFAGILKIKGEYGNLHLFEYGTSVEEMDKFTRETVKRAYRQGRVCAFILYSMENEPDRTYLHKKSPNSIFCDYNVLPIPNWFIMVK